MIADRLGRVMLLGKAKLGLFKQRVHWLWLKRGVRQAGQGLVEYGLIVASVAFVGAVAFNALADAQKDYLQEFPKNATPPSAPGALIHPTSVDPATCMPNPWTLGAPLSCTDPGVVRDTFSNPTDRNPPWGILRWYIGTTPIGSCTLPSTPTGTFNQCTPSPPIAPPNIVAWAGTTQPVTVHYESPASNHIVSSSPLTTCPAPPPLPLPGGWPPTCLYILPQLAFASALPEDPPACFRDGQAHTANTQAVGKPLTCTAKVVNLEPRGRPRGKRRRRMGIGQPWWFGHRDARVHVLGGRQPKLHYPRHSARDDL